MNLNFKFLIIFLLNFLLSIIALAQTTNDVLAKIDGQALTIQDLDAQTQEAAAKLPQDIVDLRRSELDKEIAEILFAAEARAQKISSAALLKTEIEQKAVVPPDAQIQAIYEANRAVFGDATLDQARTRIVSYLQREQKQKLMNELAEKLKAKNQIQFGIDIATPNLKPSDILAIAAGQQISAGQLLERLKPQEYALRYNLYQQTRAALTNALYNKLIRLEAARSSSQPEDVIRREISDKLRAPTDSDAKRFYVEQKAKFGNADFESSKNVILTFLADDARVTLEQNLRDRLIKKYNAQVLLKEPTAPILKINTANAASKGNFNAPVTVVMFSDFQCSHCAQEHPIISAVIKSFGAEKVRFVVRNYPLVDVHENAFRAAQAAAAAHAQNKFFEYIDLLYRNQDALDDASLKKYAAQIGLDAKRFGADLNGHKFDEQIRQDLKDGELYGVRGTPTIFINGKIVNDLSAENLKTTIQNALAKK